MGQALLSMVVLETLTLPTGHNLFKVKTRKIKLKDTWFTAEPKRLNIKDVCTLSENHKVVHKPIKIKNKSL